LIIHTPGPHVGEAIYARSALEHSVHGNILDVLGTKFADSPPFDKVPIQRTLWRRAATASGGARCSGCIVFRNALMVPATCLLFGRLDSGSIASSIARRLKTLQMADTL